MRTVLSQAALPGTSTARDRSWAKSMIRWAESWPFAGQSPGQVTMRSRNCICSPTASWPTESTNAERLWAQASTVARSWGVFGRARMPIRSFCHLLPDSKRAALERSTTTASSAARPPVGRQGGTRMAIRYSMNSAFPSLITQLGPSRGGSRETLLSDRSNCPRSVSPAPRRSTTTTTRDWRRLSAGTAIRPSSGPCSVPVGRSPRPQCPPC